MAYEETEGFALAIPAVPLYNEAEFIFRLEK